ncbi:VWA domain-containing protein [Stutzerimonas urumqiensis]|uniref:vWA domain-containing protein n=1 Tax=Stutzerimonas urumqiensis TaxID=638269 RepID=UPI003DA2E227
MNDWLPHLLRPYWLLVWPVLSWLLWSLWHRQRRTGRWQRLLPERFQPYLLTRGRLRNSRLPWVLLGIGWLLAGISLVGPSWRQLEQPALERSDPLVVLLEVTPRMLASDVAPTRLERAKRKLLDLLAARPDAQTAVVVFAGSAHTLVPLSSDIATTGNLLEAVKPSIMPEEGRRTDLAVRQALTLLEQGGQPDGRLLLIGTGIDPEAERAIREALGDDGERLSILGIGTAAGGPIVLEDGSLLKDDAGSILLPRLNAAGLRAFARELGGRYQTARLDDADLRRLELLETRGALHTQDELTRLDTWEDQGHWLLLPLVLLAAFAGRKGWLFCVPLLLVSAPPAEASLWQDLWWRADQQGARLLREQRPEEAATRFEDRRWRGLAHYLAGDYTAAAEAFAAGDTAADHYNRGNALARQGALVEAIEAYDQALERQPTLEQAERNKALVESLLEQRESAANQPAAGEPEAPPAGEATGGQSAPSPASPPSEQEAKGRSESSDEASSESSSTGTTDSTASPATNEATGDAAASPPEAGPQPSTSDEPGQERALATEQWLRRIPDDPGELLRRKFLIEQRMRQETRP